MPPDIVCSLLLAFVVFQVDAVVPQLSCRHHFLNNLRQTGVFPIRTEAGLEANLVCRMPKSSNDDVVTEVHHGLEKPVNMSGRKSVNYQISDLNWLRDLIRTGKCAQELTVDWTEVPEGKRASFTLISLLNDTTSVIYDDLKPTQHFYLRGLQSGIRHILAKDSEGMWATMTSSTLVCQQSIVQNTQCLVSGKVEIDMTDKTRRYSFAFRTDSASSNLFKTSGSGRETIVSIDNDFFIQVNERSSPVGHLSDGGWHTVTMITSDDIIVVDDVYINLPNTVNKDNKLTIELDGEVLLLDERDCQASDQYGWKDIKITSSSFCSGCSCSILTSYFQSLPSLSCPIDDDESYHLLRDSDRLSFFHKPIDTIDDIRNIRTSLTFKSDSDAGLLLFGYWQFATKGRWQVHFSGSDVFSVFCENNAEEVCRACSIKNNKNIGKDEWHRVVFYGEEDEYYLIFDTHVCQLQEVVNTNNISTAEVYSIPSVTNAGGIFIGGTYFEIKRSNLYKPEVTYKYFENTREKMPSLRGCVKDFYFDGEKEDLALIYEDQRNRMLMDSSDLKAFAILIGCQPCQPSCPSDVRCRSPSPFKASVSVCDCADIQSITTNDGTCDMKNDDPIALSTNFMAMSPIVVPLPTTKAIPENIWIKFKLPNIVRDNLVIAEFNNHREMLFRVYVSPDGKLHVESHPHDIRVFESTAYKQLHLEDNRVHLVSVKRRTPLGTRQNNRKYDLIIDGTRFEVPDYSRSTLNNISVVIPQGKAANESIILYDMGVGYDFDEHMYHNHVTNRIHQINIHSQLLPYVLERPSLEDRGIIDEYLWIEHEKVSKYPSFEAQNGQLDVSPHGQIVVYTPDVYEPELLLSARWLFYSLVLCFLLCLLLLVCLCLYCCVLRKRGIGRSSTASDRVNMLRDSPDYPVKMRKEMGIRERDSFHDDSSIGTDDTDLNAYRDINCHRVMIYRESMVSILVPDKDETQEAAIVKRRSLNEKTPPPTPPISESPAPMASDMDQ